MGKPPLIVNATRLIEQRDLVKEYADLLKADPTPEKLDDANKMKGLADFLTEVLTRLRIKEVIITLKPKAVNE